MMQDPAAMLTFSDKLQTWITQEWRFCVKQPTMHPMLLYFDAHGYTSARIVDFAPGGVTPLAITYYSATKQQREILRLDAWQQALYLALLPCVTAQPRSSDYTIYVYNAILNLHHAYMLPRLNEMYVNAPLQIVNILHSQQMHIRDQLNAPTRMLCTSPTASDPKIEWVHDDFRACGHKFFCKRCVKKAQRQYPFLIAVGSYTRPEKDEQ